MGSTLFSRSTVPVETARAALADAKQMPFWVEDAQALKPDFESLTGTVTADLVIVGGGYNGLWTAVHAKREQPDLNVVLVEAESVGWAATGRNGGFCSYSLTHGYDNGNSRWPDEMEQLERMGHENLDEIGSLIAEYGIDCEWEPTGTISVAVEPHQVEWLKEMAEEDPESVLLDAAGMRKRVNSPAYLGGLHQPHESAMLHPAKLAYGLARTASELGVTIFEHTRATGLSKSGDGMEVTTEGGRVVADRVALATNVFPSLLTRNRLFTVPVYDYVLMTEPLTKAQLKSIGWKGREGLSDVSNQFHYYRMTKDNRILWGGYDAIYHFGGQVKDSYEDRPETFERLARNFLTVFPQLEGIRFSHKWAGAIDTCSRFCAFFGTAYDGRVAYSAGYTGLGVAATHFGARVMLDLLAGRSTERTELKMVRTKPMPFPPDPAGFAAIQATRWSLNRADGNEGRRNLLLKTLDALGLGFDS